MSFLDRDLTLPRPRVLALVLLSALLLAALAAVPAHGMMMAVDPQTPCLVNGDDQHSRLQANDASVLRVVVPDYESDSPNVLRCVKRARADGYRVYLALQYRDVWSPQRVASYFARALPAFAPYVWAVSVGNEQDVITKEHLVQGGDPRTARLCVGSGSQRRCTSSTGAYYRQVWNAVEPVVARIAPKAVRAYGETSPWGFQFLKDGFQLGQPRGAQAVAFHCYDTKWGGLRTVPRVAAWAARHHLPLWCSEMGDGTNPIGWMRRDTPLQWEALLGSVQRRSPNLQMVSYYQWPQISGR